MSRKYIPTQEPKDPQKGGGFFDFLNTLEYYRNAELDNEKPIEARRILFNKRWKVLFDGMRFGGSTNGAVFFLHFLSFLLLLFAHFTHQERNLFVGYFLLFSMDALHALVKAVIPVWIISRYYLWSSGITDMYITNFVSGFVIASVSISLIKTLIFFLLAGIVWLFSETTWGTVLHKLLVFHFWYPLLQFSLVLIDLIPLGVLRRYKKTRKFREKPYHLLDEVVEDEE